MPGGKDPGANIKELESINDTPGRHRPHKQIVAIGLSQARKAGADIPAPKKMHAHGLPRMVGRDR